jgi:hypothetical protein
MRLLAEWAVPVMLAVAGCSDRSAPNEDVGHASMAVSTLLGPLESGWRLPSTGDLNGDGMQDVVWRDYPGNRVAVSLMNGTHVLEQGPMFPGPPGDGWSLISAGGDRNRDGMADLLWHNPTTNRFTVWLMDGTLPAAYGPEIPGPGVGWHLLPTRDFNGDGLPDLLWNDPAANRFTVWLMNGTEPLARGPEIPGPPGEGWIAVFGGDFDRDGMGDVFWSNPTTSRTTVWLMDGTRVRERGPVNPAPSSAEWALVAAGDFNRDLMADNLWFDKRTGHIRVSLMRGTALLAQGPEIAGPPGEGWIAGNAADCNGDGLSDVLWLNTSPLRLSVWLMGGLLPVARGPEIAGPDSAE